MSFGSSWSILTGASGYEYDGTAKSLRFTPRVTPEKFKAFFAGPEGWGSLEQERKSASMQTTGGQKDVSVQVNAIHVVAGQFVVNEILLDAPPSVAGVVVATLSGPEKEIEATMARSQSGGLRVKLAAPLTIKASQTLTILLP